MSVDGTLFVNACVCDSSYKPIQKPIVLDLNASGAHVIVEAKH